MPSQKEMLTRAKELSRYAWRCGVPGCSGAPHGIFLNNHARPSQLEPEGDWWGWFLRAGRGFGKTRTAAEKVKDRMLTIPNHRVAIIAPTFGVGRDVCIEGRSGLHGPEKGQGVIPGEQIAEWNRSLGEIRLKNGSLAKLFGTENRKDAEKLRGFEFGTGWFEELATQAFGDVAWDMLEFGLRDPTVSPKVIITSTPRPTPLIKRLSKDPDIVLRTGSTYENKANLSTKFIERIEKRYEGTTLGRQEIHGEVLDGAEGALWIYENIVQVATAPELVRIVIGVDPAGSHKKTSDETGIIVVGLGEDGKTYVLADKTGRYSPEEWRRIVGELFVLFGADVVAAEKNYGGDMVRATLRGGDIDLPVKLVQSSRGKAIRAEPVAMRYEQGLGVHVGEHKKLDLELTEWIPPGRFDEEGEPIPASKWSPNRLDALVFGVTELCFKPRKRRVTMHFPVAA